MKSPNIADCLQTVNGSMESVGTATATDNCGVASIVGTRSDGRALTDNYPVGTTTITWTATDSSGNTATATQTVTITAASIVVTEFYDVNTNGVRDAGGMPDTWDDYQALYEEALTETSTEWAPWYVVPADRKWVRDVAVAELLIRVLEELDPQIPDPEPGLEGIVVP